MLLLGLSFILFVLTKILDTSPAEKMNTSFGFRTKKSMKNEENWYVAQRLMTDYLRKQRLPNFFLGLFFLVIETCAWTLWTSEKMFIIILLIESIWLVGVLYLMIYKVNKQLT